MKIITKLNIKQPSSLIVLYLLGLSFSFIFIDREGQSTLIDELILSLMLPLALVGIFKNFYSIGLPAKLIVVYFFVAALSSFVTLVSRGDIPVAAPILGLVLDIKFIVFLGALLYLAQRTKKSGEEIITDICKAIVFIGLINAVFFMRDIFSNGISLSGIRLKSSDFYGYVPIGLFSHKIYTATISSIALAAAITLYLTKKEAKFLWVSTLFIVLLVFSSSMKELGVVVAIFFILFRSFNNRKDEISGGSKKIVIITFFMAPVFFYFLGDNFDKLISDRVNIYLLEENARAALHIKSSEIAADYFPLGSGAGTFSSHPSRSLYYSPFYYEYGMHYYYGASKENSSFLMDVGWPKFIAEAGWIGGGAYLFAYFISLLGLLISFLKKPYVINVFGVLMGALIFSSALGSAVFTGDVGLVMCAFLFFCRYLDRKKKI